MKSQTHPPLSLFPHFQSNEVAFWRALDNPEKGGGGGEVGATSKLSNVVQGKHLFADEVSIEIGNLTPSTHTC